MAALLLILTSCVDDLYPGTSGPEKLLGMDADLYTTDTLHEVMLYYSGYDSIEYAGDLTVSIYVNGDLRDETSDCRPYYDKTSDYLKYPCKPLSYKAAKGFESRLVSGTVRSPQFFINAIHQYVERKGEENG